MPPWSLHPHPRSYQRQGGGLGSPAVWRDGRRAGFSRRGNSSPMLELRQGGNRGCCSCWRHCSCCDWQCGSSARRCPRSRHGSRGWSQRHDPCPLDSLPPPRRKSLSTWAAPGSGPQGILKKAYGMGFKKYFRPLRGVVGCFSCCLAPLRSSFRSTLQSSLLRALSISHSAPAGTAAGRKPRSWLR